MISRKSMFVVAGLVLAMSQLPACSHRPLDQQRFDANNDGKNSLETSRNWWETIFVRLDSDENGSLTEDEYLAARMGRRGEFRSRGRQSEGRQEARAVRFAEMDSDSDKLVSKEEYLEYGRQRFRNRGSSFSRRRYDTNEDGKISLEESLSRSEARFVRLDDNEDGSLTRDEYVTSRFSRSSNSAWFQRRQQARAERFTEIDLDGDEVLSKQEYLDPAEQRFATRDTNGDGFLTSDEFRSRRNSQDSSTGI